MTGNKENHQDQGVMPQGLSARRRVYDVGMRTLIYVAAAIVVALLLLRPRLDKQDAAGKEADA